MIHKSSGTRFCLNRPLNIINLKAGYIYIVIVFKMKTISGFCDFCVPWNAENPDEILDILNNLIQSMWIDLFHKSLLL